MPPYSSITSARWMRVACILRKQVDRRHRGRRDTAARGRSWSSKAARDRSILPRSSSAATAFSASAAGDGAIAARAVMKRDQVADVDHADRIVERVVVDDEPRMGGVLEHLDEIAERDVAAAPRRCRRAAPSPARRAGRASPRMLRSIVLSSGEKPDSSPAGCRAPTRDRRASRPPSSRTGCGQCARASFRRSARALRPAGQAARPRSFAATWDVGHGVRLQPPATSR